MSGIYGVSKKNGKAKKKNISTLVATTIKKFMEQYHIPGVALALYVDGVPHTFSFGYADMEKKIFVTETTLFEVGSITKIFTCLLIAKEVINGSMSLADPIYRHIPSLAANKKLEHMTLEKLGTHTAALPFNAPEHVLSQKDLLKHIAHWQPPFDLRWQYSNHGMELLRIALEQSLETSIDQLLIDSILVPLSMSPIGTKVPEKYTCQRARGYDKSGKSTIFWQHPFLRGSAALCASSNDMLHFLAASLGLSETPVAIKKAMRLTQIPYIKLSDSIQYGLGWQIHDIKNFSTLSGRPVKKIKKKDQIFNGNSVFDKTGTTFGFHAYIAVIPNKKTGIVIMINRALPNGFAKVKAIGKEILHDILK